MTLSTHVALITSDEQALIVASDLAEDLRRDDTAAPGVGIPMPRRLPLRRTLPRARKGMAPWQKVGAARRS